MMDYGWMMRGLDGIVIVFISELLIISCMRSSFHNPQSSKIDFLADDSGCVTDIPCHCFLPDAIVIHRYHFSFTILLQKVESTIPPLCFPLQAGSVYGAALIFATISYLVWH